MQRQQKRKRSRAFLVSFVATFAILGGVFGVLYLTSGGPSVTHLPQAVPKYDTVWGMYAPSDAVLFSFENLTLLHSINSSLPPQSVLLQILDPNLTLSTSEVRYIATVSLQVPNASVDIAFVGQGTYDNFSRALSTSGQSPVNEGDSTLYYVRAMAGGKLELGWLATIPGSDALAYSVGASDAQQAISDCLNVAQGRSPSILSRSDVSRMLYVVGGAGGHLGLQVQDFPGLVRTGEMTLVSVDAQGGYVKVSYVVKFQDSQTALAQLGAVKSAYLSSHQFEVYDSYVKAVAYQPLSSVEGAIRLVE